MDAPGKNGEQEDKGNRGIEVGVVEGTKGVLTQYSL